jgi:DNA repair exonuclease SbcCD ATPase subunit
MILHSLSIRHWRNIGELELTGLDHPIVVLYGPNRTGKSSLVAALRSCLLDFDHDSAAAERDNSPWHAPAIPEVAVEFETGGHRYRLLKRFSKRKDGGAALERRNGSAWQLVERDKEAGREARKILGLDKSNDGLNQLLWLGQGETVLPPEKNLNLSLQKRFEAVLGSLLTGRDWDFYSALKRECGTFFTGTMAPKKGSPVAEAAERQSHASARCEELRRRFQQADRLRSDFEQALRDIEEAERLVAESRDEVARLQTAQSACRERRRSHELALAALAGRKKELADAVARLEDLRQAQQRLAETQIAGVRAHATLAELESQYQAAAARAETAREAARRTRAEIDAHEALRTELDDRRRLLELARSAGECTQALERARRLQQRREEIDGELSQQSAPEKKEIDNLRKNREQALHHRAALDAGLLRLTIRPSSAGTVQIEVDEAAAKSLALNPEEPHELPVRQRAALTIENFGTIELKRGRTDRSLDELQHELEQLDRAFHDAAAAYGLDSNQPDLLAALEQRRVRRDELLKDRRQCDEQIAAVAPDGIGALEAESTKVTAEQSAIVERQPSLAGWVPDASDYDERLRSFQRTLKESRSRHAAAEEQQQAADRSLAEAEERRQAARVMHGQLAARVESAEAELKRLGDERSLEETCRIARQAVAEAEQRVHETRLTADEAAIDLNLETARGALEVREERWRGVVSRREQLRFDLRSLQGLHEDLAAAEAELAVAQREYDDLRLTAESHRLLRELFEQNRDAQVRRTTGVLGGRVFAWAKQLGIEDYEDLDFTAGYLPTGLRRAGADEPVALETESFGTTEQLSLLVRLAAGGILARGERQLAIFDDPLTHSDRNKHRRIVEILQAAATGHVPSVEGAPPAGPLQILILTCHPERFDHLRDARQINLESLIRR